MLEAKVSTGKILVDLIVLLQTGWAVFKDRVMVIWHVSHRQRVDCKSINASGRRQI